MPKPSHIIHAWIGLWAGLQRLRAADFGMALAVAVAYFVAARLSLAIQTPEGFAHVDLSAGAAVGALLALRPALRPLIVGALIAAGPLASLLGGESFAASLVHAIADAGEALLTAALIERWLPRPLKLEEFASVLGLFAAAAIAAILGQATLALALQSAGGAPVPFILVWRQLAWANVTGIVLVAPVIIALAAALRSPPPARELIEGAAVLVLQALLSAHALELAGIEAGHWMVLAPGFSQLPLLLWLSIRCGPLFAAAGSSMLGLVMLGSFALERGRYGDAAFTLGDERALASRVAIVVTIFAAVAIGALIAQRKRAEAEARRGEIAGRREAEETAALLSAIVECSSDAIVSKALDGTVTSWNVGAERLLGYTASEMVGQSIRRIIPAGRIQDEDAILARIAAGEVIDTYETVRLHKDGQTVDVSLTVSPVRDRAGRVIGASKVLRNITGSKRAEQALRRSERRYRSFVEVTAQFAWVTDSKGLVVEDIPALRAFTGQTYDEAKGAGWATALHPDDLERALEVWDNAVSTKSQYEVEYRMRRHDGMYRTLLARGVPVLDEQGDAVEWVGTCIDITERKQAEAALRESEEQFRTLADAIPQLAWMANADGWITWYNCRWYEYTGATPEQMEGWGWRSVHAPETLPAVLERWKKSISTGEPFDMVFPLRGADGVFRPFLTRIQPLRNAEGRVVRWFGTNTDVGDLKRAEEALRQSEERYRGIFQHAGTGIAIIDLEGEVLSCNPALTAMLGYSDEELRSLFSCELVHPEDRQANMAGVRRLLGENLPSFEIVNRYVRKDGAPIWVHKHLSLLRDAAGRPSNIIALVTDISERKRSEAAIQASEERLRAIVGTAIDAIIIIDETGRIESVNPATERIFGYTSTEMVGQSVSMLMPEPHRSRHDGYISSYLDTGEARVAGRGREVEGKRKDGSSFPADLSLVEWRLEGRRYFTGILRDITERKQREEQVKFLMKEVNHRAKNMLALVQAIAAQTAATSSQPFIERFSERIRALAASQDLLVRSQWRGVELADLVRSQLAHFGCLIGSRILLEGPPLRISAKAAQPIGMAVHELATNAGKYGALSSGAGEVIIAWAIDRNGAGENLFRLSWSERGGPEVRTPARRGFGATVVAKMPRMELDAEVALDYEPDGVKWRIVCPVENVLDISGGEAGAQEAAA